MAVAATTKPVPLLFMPKPKMRGACRARSSRKTHAKNHRIGNLHCRLELPDSALAGDGAKQHARERRHQDEQEQELARTLTSQLGKAV